MRTSLNEISLIEKFLFQELPAEDQVLFQAKNILDKELKMKVFLQKKIYRLVNLFHKKELKKQAEEVYSALMDNPNESAFRNEILAIFKEDTND
jgi:hypothetical protein